MPVYNDRRLFLKKITTMSDDTMMPAGDMPATEAPAEGEVMPAEESPIA